jgi:hypothetical protein
MISKIPDPAPGQPVDLTYLSKIVGVVNGLVDNNISRQTTKKYVSLDTITAGTQNLLINEVRMAGGYAEATIGTSSNSQPFTYRFSNTEFKYPPIVVATPIVLDQTSTSGDISVVLQSVTNSSISGSVRTNKTGTEVRVGVYLMMIGVPN